MRPAPLPLQPPKMDQETRIQNAIYAIRNDEALSVRKAAILFEVPRSTLQGRLAGFKTHAEANEPFQRLTVAEEASVVEIALQMQVEGLPLTIHSLESLALRFLKAKNDTEPLGHSWYSRFMARHPELKFTKSRGLGQKRQDAKVLTLDEMVRQREQQQQADQVKLDEKARKAALRGKVGFAKMVWKELPMGIDVFDAE